MINKVRKTFVRLNIADLFFLTVKIFNDKIQQILNDIKSTSDLAKPVNEVQQKGTMDIIPEFFYDMQPEHFGAEKVRKSIFVNRTNF